jgi:organic radical activating enzyme
MTSIYCSELNNSYDINFNQNKFSHCCKFIPIIVEESEVQRLQHKYFDNNRETVKARQDLASGVQTSRCNDCWRQENKNSVSWRQHKNLGANENLVTINLQLSNLCNQTCFYCSPDYSTSIVSLGQWLHSDSVAVYSIIPRKNYSSITIQHIADFIKDLPENIRAIDFGITGGEPFIVENFEDDVITLARAFLDKNVENTISIGISTNGNTKSSNILKFYNNIKESGLKDRIKITVILSIENLEERAEYVRDGLNWITFVENFKIHHSMADKTNIRMTFNAFTIVKIVDFIKYFGNYNVNFLYNYTHQQFFRPEILDQRFNSELISLDNYIRQANIDHKFEGNFHKNLQGILLNDVNNAEKFRHAITQLDLIKKRNWRTVFPEYINWFDKC